jgi:integrase
LAPAAGGRSLVARGSITRRTGKRGISWLVTYDVGRDLVTGKRRQKRFTAKTRKEAEERLAKVLHELRSGAYLEPSAELLATYLPRWLEHASPTIAPATAHRYEIIIRRYLVPELGEAQLGRLTPMAVQELYRHKLAEGLAPSTVSYVHAVLHRALDQAVKWQLVARNVSDAVDAPRAQTSAMQVWTADEMRTFLRGTTDHPWAALWRLALLIGMRRGELLALQWGDLDLDRRQLAIRRTMSRSLDGKWVPREGAKSASGRRPIALPASCVEALQRHKVAQLERRVRLGSGWPKGDLVFDRGDGIALDPSVLCREFTRQTLKHKLPPIRFHDMRHTAATFMLTNGDHPKVVSERLGHASVRITLDLYSHVLPDTQRDSADRLDEALGA